MDTTRLSKKTFQIQLFALMSDGTQLPLGNYIRLLEIKQMFQNEVFPTFQMKMEVPPEYMIQMQADSKKMVFSLEIESSELSEQSSPGVITNTYLKQIILKPLMMDKRPVSFTQSASDPNVSTNNINYQKEIFEVICVPENALKANKQLVSGVLRNSTITEALVYLTNKTGLPSYIYQPDNLDRQEQILLRPGNVLENIEHINSIYGIYNDDLKLFITHDKLLLAPMEGIDISEQGNIAVEVNFPVDKSDISTGDTMSYVDYDPTTNFYNKVLSLSINRISLSNYDELMNEVYGTKVFYQNRTLTSAFNQESNNIEVSDRRGLITKTHVYMEKYANHFTRKAQENKAWSNTVIRMIFDDVDLTMEDAYRRFTFNFNNAYYKDKYSGSYKALSMSYVFRTYENGTTSIQGNGIFRKI